MGGGKWRSVALMVLALAAATGQRRDALEEEGPLMTSMFLIDQTLRERRRHQDHHHSGVVGRHHGAGFRAEGRVMLASILDPFESPAHRRGAFSDTIGLSTLSSGKDGGGSGGGGEGGGGGGGARLGKGKEDRKHQKLRAAGDVPTPEPMSLVEPLALETLDGELLLLQGGEGKTFLISIYYDSPKYAHLWTSANLEHLARDLPDTAHLVFGVSSQARDGAAALEGLRARLNAVDDFAKIALRVHFLAEPVEASCSADVFPNCPDTGHGWLGQAVNGWGTINPSLTALFDGRSEHLPSAGDTGWLKPITTLARENRGGLKLDLAVWGGEACSASEHPADDLEGKVVLVERGTCTFFEKVSAAAKKGAAAVLVRDIEENGSDQHRMGCGSPQSCEDAGLGVSGAVISYKAGVKLQEMVAEGTKVQIEFTTRLQGEHLIGLDHEGRLREMGRVPPTGVEAVHSWHFVALEAQYYDYQREVAERVAAMERVEVLSGGRGQVLAGGAGIQGSAVLPGKDAMSRFGGMHVHVKLECPTNAEKSCGQWDYAVTLRHCGEPREEQGVKGECDVEVGRFVTAYGRPGEWMVDATALLPLMRQGGKHVFSLSQPDWSAQRYRATVSLLFDEALPGAPIPQSSTFLFSGGKFDGDYNKMPSHAPLRIKIPHDAKRVELHSTISGHGWGTTEENCAEFCVTEHRFMLRPALAVNQQLFVASDDQAFTNKLGGAGDELGCASVDRVRGGVTPNQYGTWQYGRAGWCPGGNVRRWVQDVSDAVRPGLDAVVSYEGLFNSTNYRPRPCSGDGCGEGATPPSITMQSFLVVYTDADAAGQPGGKVGRGAAAAARKRDGGGGGSSSSTDSRVSMLQVHAGDVGGGQSGRVDESHPWQLGAGFITLSLLAVCAAIVTGASARRRRSEYTGFV